MESNWVYQIKKFINLKSELAMDDRTVDLIFAGSLESLPPVSSKIVRIFTSSTFTGEKYYILDAWIIQRSNPNWTQKDIILVAFQSKT